MLTKNVVRTFMGAVAGAVCLTMTSCNRPGKVSYEPKTDVELAQERLNEAQKQYAADSTAFVQMAPDSTALKETLAQLQRIQADYYRVSDEDTENLGKNFDSYYKNLAQSQGEKVPVDSNAVKIQEKIEEVIKNLNISTGKNAAKSKAWRDEALETLEAAKQREMDLAKEKAIQDSICRENAKKDSLIQSELYAEQKRLEEGAREIQKLIERTKEYEKKEFEQAKQVKEIYDKLTKARKDSVMKEFEEIK